MEVVNQLLEELKEAKMRRELLTSELNSIDYAIEIMGKELVERAPIIN